MFYGLRHKIIAKNGPVKKGTAILAWERGSLISNVPCCPTKIKTDSAFSPSTIIATVYYGILEF